jgi:cytochrome d ubiquinol oxidase subunit I
MVGCGLIMLLLFAFGVVYLHRLLRAGPLGRLVLPAAGAVPRRPMSVVDAPLLRSMNS